MILDLEHFVRTERPYWDELESMLNRMEEHHDVNLSLQDVRRFHFLYDLAASDLLRLSTFASSPEIAQHL